MGRFHKAVIATSFVVFFLAIVPGLILSDEASMLCSGRAGYHGNWHPPLLQYLFAFADWIVAGPLLLFIPTLVTYYVFFYRFVCVLEDRRVRTAAVVVFFATPILLSEYFIVVKNVIALSVALVLYLWLYTRGRERARDRWIACGLSVVAMMLQHQMFVVLAPVFWFLFAASASKRNKLVAAGAFVGTVLVAQLASAALTDLEEHPIQQVFIHDVWAIAKAEDKVPLGGTEFDLTSIRSKDELLALYTPDNNLGVVWNFDLRDKLITFDNSARVRRLFELWLVEVSHHPWSYFEHRLATYLHLVRGYAPVWRLTSDVAYASTYSCWALDVGRCANARCAADIGRVDWPGAALRIQPLSNAILDFSNGWMNRFTFNGGLLLLGLVCGIVLVRRYRSRLGAFLLSTLVLEQVTLFFVAPASNRRYYVLSLAVSLMLAFLTADAARKKRA
ncbi:MAG: hypothetical protein SFX73_06460 [Kofleriaceae bacterium]|nr:hypothetical protein [Kofleriaceae bacterium]